MPNYLLAMNAKLYQGTAGDAIGDLIEVSNVKDVTVNNEAASADVTTRANNGYRAKAATLKDLSLDFQMVWKPGDSGFDAIRAAYDSGGQIEIAALDQDRATSGAQGPKGSFTVSNFTRTESLEEAIMVSVKVDLSLFDQWIEI